MEASELQYFMNAAIEEGKKALPDCFPNPPVGCVIVREGKIIAEGHTNPPGAHHAEAMALSQIPEGIDDLTIFVTLEPCSFVGKTPSCAKAIIARGIQKVYVGIIDPHPKNNGTGIDLLKAAGVQVEVGLMAKEIEDHLSPYLIRTL